MDVMTLVAKLTLDTSEYDRGLSDSEKKASVFGDVLKGNLASTAITKGFSVLSNGFKTTAGAIKNITTSAVEGYSESQQLVGGIQTLFGDEAPKVISKANNAFKTAGLSANDYMDTTIQSAAAMITSLGGDQKKAAELMDLSITDMADNVNKMGTSVEGVQNAYRGFSRGNFTMLDNLALGYSGTKEGMQELLTKAEELEKQQGRSTKYSIDNYADIVQAIHVVQTEMGITGTTSKEADQTISGSLASMKTAWQNLVNGLADPDADIGQLIENMVDSAKTALKNILPAVKQALKGISELITQITPVITEELPGIVDDVAPSLIQAVASLIAALITALPNLIQALVDVLPQVMQTIGEAIKEAWPAIQDAIMSGLNTSGGKVIAGVMSAWTAIKGLGIVSGVTNAISVITPLISSLVSPIGLIVAAVAAAAVAIITNWDKIKAVWKMAKVFFGNVWKGIQDVFKNVGTWISDKFKSAFNGVTNVWKNIKTKFNEYKEAIMDAFKNLPEKFVTVGKNLLTGLGNGLVDGAKSVVEKAKKVAGNVLDAVKGFFGVSSPSKVFHQVGGFLMEGMANGIGDNLGLVEDAVGEMESLIPKSDVSASITAKMAGNGRDDGQYFTVPRQQAPRQQTVILQLDRMTLGRAVYMLNDEETRRIGVRLAGGYA